MKSRRISTSYGQSRGKTFSRKEQSVPTVPLSSAVNQRLAYGHPRALENKRGSKSRQKAEYKYVNMKEGTNVRSGERSLVTHNNIINANNVIINYPGDRSPAVTTTDDRGSHFPKSDHQLTDAQMINDTGTTSENGVIAQIQAIGGESSFIETSTNRGGLGNDEEIMFVSKKVEKPRRDYQIRETSLSYNSRSKWKSLNQPSFNVKHGPQPDRVETPQESYYRNIETNGLKINQSKKRNFVKPMTGHPGLRNKMRDEPETTPFSQR